MIKTIETIFPDTDWETLILKTDARTTKILTINSKDKDNEIEINYEEDNVNLSIYLNQDQIKNLVKFLQKQITQE